MKLKQLLPNKEKINSKKQIIDQVRCKCTRNKIGLGFARIWFLQASALLDMYLMIREDVIKITIWKFLNPRGGLIFQKHLNSKQLLDPFQKRRKCLLGCPSVGSDAINMFSNSKIWSKRGKGGQHFPKTSEIKNILIIHVGGGGRGGGGSAQLGIFPECLPGFFLTSPLRLLTMFHYDYQLDCSLAETCKLAKSKLQSA